MSNERDDEREFVNKHRRGNPIGRRFALISILVIFLAMIAGFAFQLHREHVVIVKEPDWVIAPMPDKPVGMCPKHYKPMQVIDASINGKPQSMMLCVR